MFFPQPDDPERLFPLDLIPRLISRQDWEELRAGLVQRVRTLEMLLQDLHGERACLHDGVLPREALRWLPTEGEASTLVPAGRDAGAVSGLDLVRDGEGRWLVLEDNLRVPSGIAYAMADRRLVRSVLPELRPRRASSTPTRAPAMLRRRRCSRAPRRRGRRPRRSSCSPRARTTRRTSSTGCWPRRWASRSSSPPSCWSPTTGVTGRGGRAAGRRGLPADRRGRLCCTPPAPTAARWAGPAGRGARRAGRAGQRARQRGRRRQGDLRLRPAADRVLPGRAAAARRRADLPLRRPRAAPSRARPARRAGHQAGRRLRRGGRGDRPARRAPRSSSAGGRDPRADPPSWVAQEIVALSTHPTFDRQPSWSRGASTCARSSSSGAASRGVAADAALTRVAPGRQHGRQLVARRRREGHLDPALAARACVSVTDGHGERTHTSTEGRPTDVRTGR